MEIYFYRSCTVVKYSKDRIRSRWTQSNFTFYLCNLTSWKSKQKCILSLSLFLIYNIYQSYNVINLPKQKGTPCLSYISNRCAIFGIQPLVKLLWMLKVWKISRVFCIVFLLGTFIFYKSMSPVDMWTVQYGYQNVSPYYGLITYHWRTVNILSYAWNVITLFAWASMPDSGIHFCSNQTLTFC